MFGEQYAFSEPRRSCFCSAVLAPVRIILRHRGRSWAQTSQLVTSMLKLVSVFLRGSELFWSAVIRHPCHVASPSHLSFLQQSVNARDACSCEELCVSMSCHFMRKIIRKHFVWMWLSFLA